MSLLGAIQPLNLHLLLLVVRFNEVSCDIDISRNGNCSHGSMVSGIDRLILGRELSSDFSRRFDLDLLSVVDYVRLNVVFVVDLVSFYIDSSCHFSVFLSGRLSDRISLKEFVLLLDKNRVKGFSDSVHVRLYNDLLTGRFNKSINDISGLSNYSFSNHFWFLHNSVDDGLWLGAYSLNRNFCDVEIESFCLFASDGKG